mmetsp:Transcript_19683/g.17398  ORF Transcript_19683/g.17398 Transcript_19683/m.17398 type:complete len:163 (-) Transcript_19683:28-516(-)
MYLSNQNSLISDSRGTPLPELFNIKSKKVKRYLSKRRGIQSKLIKPANSEHLKLDFMPNLHISEVRMTIKMSKRSILKLEKNKLTKLLKRLSGTKASNEGFKIKQRDDKKAQRILNSNRENYKTCTKRTARFKNASLGLRSQGEDDISIFNISAKKKSPLNY